MVGIFGQDDEDTLSGVHEVVVGFRNVLALIVCAACIMQGRADDPSYFVLVFVKDGAYDFAERRIAWPDLGKFDGWFVFLEMRSRRVLLALIPHITDGIVVGRSYKLCKATISRHREKGIRS